MEESNVYTDGACKGNPGPGGWGWIEYKGPVNFYSYGGEEKTTNNRMELTAVIDFFESTPYKGKFNIHTDSKYVLNALVGSDCLVKRTYSGYLGKWKNSGYKKVKNVDLWKNLDILIQNHLLLGSIIKIKYVKAHVGIVGNEKADELANLGVPLQSF